MSVSSSGSGSAFVLGGNTIRSSQDLILVDNRKNLLRAKRYVQVTNKINDNESGDTPHGE